MFGLSYFRDKSHFEDDSTQNYLVFQSVKQYLKTISNICNSERISAWKLKELSDKSIKPSTTSSSDVQLY